MLNVTEQKVHRVKSSVAGKPGTPREVGEGGRELKKWITFMVRGDVSRIMKVNADNAGVGPH